jgi:23S rRNA maturation-related 3'-5' exoribonuclease YhaM
MRLSDKDFNFLGPFINSKAESLKGSVLGDLLVQTKRVTDFFSFQICPGASVSTKHHFYAGGLQQHTYEILKYGLAVLSADSYPWSLVHVNENAATFIIAAVWHDIGKVYDYERIYCSNYLIDSIDDNGNSIKEHKTKNYCCSGLCIDERKTYENYYRSGMVIKKNFHAKMVSHLSRSYYEFTKTATDMFGSQAMTNEYVLMIQNAILAHHGRYEFGSPKEPNNWLSILLHQADYFSAHCSIPTAYINNNNF